MNYFFVEARDTIIEMAIFPHVNNK